MVRVRWEGTWGWVTGRFREGGKDDVPLGRALAEWECAGPVADKLMSVGRAADRDRRDCGDGRCGGDSGWRAWLGGRGECLHVGKAVRVAKTFRGADVPREQGYVLQVVGGSACMSDKGFRCRKIVLGVRIGGFEKEVSG